MNQQLVQGAGMVAKSEGLVAQAIMQNAGAYQKMFSSIGKQYLDYTKKKGGEFDEHAQKVLDTAGELPAGEYEKLYDELAQGRKNYISGDRKERALLQRDLNLKATDLGEYKEFRNIMSELQLDKESGLSSSFTDSDEGQEYLSLLQDSSKLVTKKCTEENPNCADGGRMGINMMDYDYVGSEEFNTEAAGIEDQILKLQESYIDIDGNPYEMTEEDKERLQGLQNQLNEESDSYIGRKFVSVSTLKQNLDNHRIDGESRGLINNLAQNHAIASGNVKEGQVVDFPEKITRETVASTIIGKAKNVDSLIYDEMIPGRTFFGDLMDMIAGQHIVDDPNTPDVNESLPQSKENTAWGRTYADLGITPEQLAIADVNADNIIDAEEAKAIAKELLKNETDRNTYLTNYYTQYIKQQWDNGAQSRATTAEGYELVYDKNGKNPRYVKKT
jgi:hypothetical protein